MPSYPLVLCLAFAVAGSLTVAVAAWTRRDDPIVKAFLALALGSALWSGGRLLELNSADLETRILWAKLQYIGIVAVPIGWLCAMIQLSRPGFVIPWSLLSLPIVINLVTMGLVFTNERHHLIWTSITLVPGGAAPGAVFAHGPAYAAAAVYTYLLLAASLYFLLSARVPNSSLTRGGRAVLAGGLALPLLANVAYLRGWTGPLGGDLTPATFSVTAVLVWICALRGHLDDVGHYARLRVFDALHEGCVIANADDVIVDFNPAALRLLTTAKRGDPLPAAWRDAVAASRSGTRGGNASHLISEEQADYELTVESVCNLNNRPVGIIVFLRDVTRFRSREQALTVENSSLALRLGETEEKLSRIEADLYRDALTGAFNRRFFQREATSALASAFARGIAVGLLIIDVDYFKQYNDHHGHVHGDACLRRVAEAIAQAMRNGPDDFCARVGGEEFAMVLPAVTPGETREVGLRLLKAVRAMALPHGGWPGHPCVTISVGAVCEIPASPLLEALLERADAAMYEAKRAGRDRFVMGETASLPA
ncbi:histidine kinase N-terminal 7TM domain-containing protein [Cupriavidus basilensis]|uniref:diguanylate cyclase n=1 Tax=Cupriavidus basilensis TaxID=68895 RepID=A0ABT6ARK5_9BURK|nr:histidine kinase N-terminal 7TM domain-containing protein [Cupriavidus basilensis]MDF3835251.1 histidine kinase N-terminal 7TM domain-containing protein [Cupriavidus basilensis]